MRVAGSSALLALAAAAVRAVPMGAPAGFEDAAVDKALRDRGASSPAPQTTPAPSPEVIRRAIDRLTVTVTNMHTADIKTRHAIHPGKPKPVDPAQKEVTTGVIKKGGSAVYIVSKEYIGSVFVSDAKYTPGEHCTQIEVSVINGKNGFDISNVTGWSVPIVCSCQGDNGMTYESGCNQDLAGDANKNPALKCEDWVKEENACANPYRDNSITRVAKPFFKKCQGKSYTFVHDHEALRYDLCKKSTMQCCVGQACKYKASAGSAPPPAPPPGGGAPPPPAPPPPAPGVPAPAPPPPPPAAPNPGAPKPGRPRPRPGRRPGRPMPPKN